MVQCKPIPYRISQHSYSNRENPFPPRGNPFFITGVLVNSIKLTKSEPNRGQKSNAIYEFFHPESCWEELRADLMLPAADKNHFHYMAALCKLPSLPNWKGFSAIFQRPLDLQYKKQILYLKYIFFCISKLNSSS